jgi:hypothetical protein
VIPSAQPVRHAVRPAPQAVAIAFDFDCTLTVRHLYKALAWGFLPDGHPQRPPDHPHHPEMEAWVKENEPTLLHATRLNPQWRPEPPAPVNEVSTVLDFLASTDADAYRRLMRDFFFGGDQRIIEMQAFFRDLEARGAELYILTAGVASSVSQVLAMAVPEWLQFFPSNRIYDVGHHRHKVSSIVGMKMLILRDVAGKKGFLVDDSLAKEALESWVPDACEIRPLDILEYEGEGIHQAERETIMRYTMEMVLA